MHAEHFLVAVASWCSATLASAQAWLAQDIIAKTSSSEVRLQTTRNSETVTLDVVRRSWVERAVAVTGRLAPAYGMSVPQVYLISNKDPNAFVTNDRSGNPLMVVNTAMLRLIGDNDDDIAAVIGHELGHLQARHLTDGHAKQSLVGLLGVLAGLAVDLSQAKRGVDTQGAGMQLGALGSGLVNAKFNRDQEREADDLGVKAMARAGYDPQAVPRLWRRLATTGSGGAGLWLDSHPSHAEREQAMQVAAVALAPTVAARPVDSEGLVQPNDPWPSSTYSSLSPTAEELAEASPNAYRRGFEASKAARQEEAIAAYKEAIDESLDERAMAQLGAAYLTGRGVPKDEALALEYFRRSASKGFAPAILMLGDMAQRGIAQPADSTVAVNMFALARKRGWYRAGSRLSLMYMTGDGVSKDQFRARSLAQEASDKGDALGKAVYGAMLRDGIGGVRDVGRGFDLLNTATESAPDLGFAHFQLAMAYEKGSGVPSNKELAIASYRKALATGASGARERLKELGVSDEP